MIFQCFKYSHKTVNTINTENVINLLKLHMNSKEGCLLLNYKQQYFVYPIYNSIHLEIENHLNKFNYDFVNYSF